MRGTHFAFGENWDSFSNLVSEERIEAAQAGLMRLFPDGLAGRVFLDIGCGSGLSMLAALRLRATSVHGIDIDADSVSTARRLLTRYADGEWAVTQKSVFDLDPITDGLFPVVYSWGVLHHTGNMADAIGKAAAMVAPGGTLAIALYRKTPLCGAWTIEKRLYSASPKAVQRAISSAYKASFLALRTLRKGENPFTYAKSMKSRGMDWHHDVHDWLGGYPYESAAPEDIIDALGKLGFETRHIDPSSPRLGLFGTICNEYVGQLKAA